MKKILYALAALCLMLSLSCGPVIFMLTPLKYPRVENAGTLREYLHKMDLNDDNILVFRDSTTFFRHMKKFFKVPEIFYFNHDGYLTRFRDTAACTNENYVLLTLVDKVNQAEVDSSFTLIELLQDLKTLDGNDIDPNLYMGSDVILFITWGKFGGPLNNKVREWENMVMDQQHNIDIRTVKLNVDFQEMWGGEVGEMWINKNFKCSLQN